MARWRGTTARKILHGGKKGGQWLETANVAKGEAMRRIASTSGRTAVQCRPRRIAKKSVRSRAVGDNGTKRRPDLQREAAPAAMVFSFGATCVGVLLERMRRHLGTQRFLAARRGDRMWEVSCDYAALSLEHLGTRLRPEAFAAELFPAADPRNTPLRCHATRGGESLCAKRKSKERFLAARPSRLLRMTANARPAARGGR